MRTMNRILVAWLLIFSLTGCGSDTSQEQKEIVIQVNDSKICLEEFNELVKFETYADPDLKLTDENRDKFIDYLVTKELMIQHASLINLDRKPEFILAIEKYWESTLICNLLDLKSEELKKKILITDGAIGQYYTQNKDEFERPLAEVKDDIKKIIEREKLEEMLKEWTEGLKQGADIKIDKEMISK